MVGVVLSELTKLVEHALTTCSSYVPAECPLCGKRLRDHEPTTGFNEIWKKLCRGAASPGAEIVEDRDFHGPPHEDQLQDFTEHLCDEGHRRNLQSVQPHLAWPKFQYYAIQLLSKYDNKDDALAEVGDVMKYVVTKMFKNIDFQEDFPLHLLDSSQALTCVRKAS